MVQNNTDDSRIGADMKTQNVGINSILVPSISYFYPLQPALH